MKNSEKEDTLIQYNVNNIILPGSWKIEDTVYDGNCGVQAVKQLLLQCYDSFQTTAGLNISDGKNPIDLGDIRADIVNNAIIYLRLYQKLDAKAKALKGDNQEDNNPAALASYDFNDIVNAYKAIFNNDIEFFKIEVQSMLEAILGNEKPDEQNKFKYLANKVSSLENWDDISSLTNEELNDIVNQLQNLTFDINDVLSDRKISYDKTDKGEVIVAENVIAEYFDKISSNKEKLWLTSSELIAYLHKYGLIQQKVEPLGELGTLLPFKHYATSKEIYLYNNSVGPASRGTHWVAAANRAMPHADAALYNIENNIEMWNEEEMQVNETSEQIETNSNRSQWLKGARSKEKVVYSLLGKREAQTPLSKVDIECEEMNIINTSSPLFNISTAVTMTKNIDNAIGQSEKLIPLTHVHNINIEYVEKKLLMAVLGKHLDEVKYLIEREHANVNTKHDYWTAPIYTAALRGEMRLVESLAQQLNIALDSTYVIELLLSGNKELIAHLISKGVPMSAKDNLGWTVLMCAAAMGNKEMVKFLITKGAQLDAKDNNGMTALMWAAVNGYTDVVELLMNHKAEIDTKHNDGMTALMWAAVNGHIDVVELLINHKAQTETNDNGDQTELMVAIEKHNKEVVKFLVNKVSGINTVDSDNRIPIVCYAARYTDIKMVDLLLHIKVFMADKHTIQKNLTARDSEDEDYDSENEDYDSENEDCRPPLQIVVKMGGKGHLFSRVVDVVDIVALSRERSKANVWDMVDLQKISELAIALSFGKFELAKLLINNMQEVSAYSHHQLWDSIVRQAQNLEEAIGVIYCIVSKYKGNTQKALLSMKDAALKYAQYCKQNAVQDKDNVLKVQKNCIKSFLFTKNFEKTFSKLKKVDKEWIKKLFDAEHEKNDTQVVEKMQESVINDLIGSTIVDFCDQDNGRSDYRSTNNILASRKAGEIGKWMAYHAQGGEYAAFKALVKPICDQRNYLIQDNTIIEKVTGMLLTVHLCKTENAEAGYLQWIHKTPGTKVPRNIFMEIVKYLSFEDIRSTIKKYHTEIKAASQKPLCKMLEDELMAEQADTNNQQELQGEAQIPVNIPIGTVSSDIVMHLLGQEADGESDAV